MIDEPKWIEWGPDSPGYPKCPVPDGHEVEVRFRSQTTDITEDIKRYHWAHHWAHVEMSFDIVAYRDWTAFKNAKATPPAEPEWTPWGPDSPGYPKCPVHDEHKVQVRFTSQTTDLDVAKHYDWVHEERGCDIVAYRDWAAFNNAKATPPAEPEPSDEACVRAYDMWHEKSGLGRQDKIMHVRHWLTRIVIARLIEAHVPLPVDPLRLAVEGAVGRWLDADERDFDNITASLREYGVHRDAPGEG